MKNVLFVINSLAGGGAERVFSQLVNHLGENDESLRISVALLDDIPDKYVLSDQLSVTRLGAGGSLLGSVRGLVAHVRNNKPDLIVSFLNRANYAAIIAGGLFRVPVVVSERVNTSSHFGSGMYGLVSRTMVRLLYPRANHVICVSEGVERELVQGYGVRKDKTTVIRNPVNTRQLRENSKAGRAHEHEQEYIVAVGRLVENKDCFSLIEAFGKSKITADLYLLGEGPEKERLKSQISELDLENRVKLLGFVENPHAYMAGAKAYVSTSRAEGFPNALLEAVSLGVPSIATDCDSGPSELLGGNTSQKVTGMTFAPYGVLVPVGDIEEISKALDAVEDNTIPSRYKDKCSEVSKSYDVSSICNQYRQALSSALK